MGTPVVDRLPWATSFLGWMHPSTPDRIDHMTDMKLTHQELVLLVQDALEAGAYSVPGFLPPRWHRLFYHFASNGMVYFAERPDQ